MNIIRELRKKKGMQQKELALSIGVAQPTVSDWESNKKDPSGDRLKKLAELFDVDELVILGKGVVDLTDEANLAPQTVEARIVANAMDRMTKEQRKQVLAVLRAMFPTQPDLFNNEETSDQIK